MNHENAREIKSRAAVKMLEETEITEILGENHFQSMMALFKWTAYRAPRQLDNRKIDYICRYQHALLEVQVKSRIYNGKTGKWRWDILGNSEEIDPNFTMNVIRSYVLLE